MHEMDQKSGFSIKAWFSDKHNLYFVLILLAALAVRLYYFFQTNGQALWWDEAEYGLRAKAFAFGTPLTGWAPERELVVPLLFSFILRLGGTETTLHLVQILVSIATVAISYLLISQVLGKKQALYASFGLAFFWLHIFFTQRILLYLWAPLAFVVIVYFFYTGYIHNQKRHLIYFGIAAGVGLAIYFSVGFLLFGLAIYLLLTERLSLFTNKKAWIALGVFLLVLSPYMIYSQATYGFPIPRLATGLTAATTEYGAGFAGLFAYIAMFPSRVGWPYTLLSFAGLALVIYHFIIGFGVKDYMVKQRGRLLIAICFAVPLALYTLYGVVGGSATFYDAFILPVFPFAFALAGDALNSMVNALKKYHSLLAIACIVLLLGLHLYFGVTQSDATIRAKISSYDSVKYAGEWIKENSAPGDIVISRSIPQNTYYSERETFDYPGNASEMDRVLQEQKPKYIIDSVWEATEPWIHEYAHQHQDNLTLLRVYYLDQAQTQPSLAIYELK